MNQSVYLENEYRAFLAKSRLAENSQRSYFSQIKSIAKKFEAELGVHLFDLIEQSFTLDPGRELFRLSLSPSLLAALERIYVGKSLSDARSHYKKYEQFLSYPTTEVETSENLEDELQESDYEQTERELASQTFQTSAQQLGYFDLHKKLQFRLKTQDRAYGDLIIPNRLLASLAPEVMNNCCEESIDSIAIYTKQGSIALSDIRILSIDPEGFVFVMGDNCGIQQVFTPLANSEERQAMRVKDFRFIHIDHTDSLQEIALAAAKQNKLPALSKLSNILRALGVEKARDFAAYKAIKETLVKHAEYSDELIRQAIDELGQLTKQTGLRLMEATQNRKKHKN